MTEEGRIVPGPLNNVRNLRGRVFPDHWSLLFGQIAFYSFVLVTLTGLVLMVPYQPSVGHVVYDGPYAPLHGVQMSQALDSTMKISFEMRGGLLIRQMHHWGALIMVAAILLHLLRLFFTAGFRRPRRLKWLVVFGLLIITLGACLTGTSLPDDMASGTSLAVLDGVLQATPFVGTQLSALLFGGDFPGDVISRFYPLHIIVLPALLVVLFMVSGILALKNKPAQFPGPGRTEENVVGSRAAVAVVKGAGLFCFVAAVVTLMASLATINPVWLFGPADPADTSAGVGPAWYLAFLDGALRLAPGWEAVWWGRTISFAILLPVGVCTLFLALLGIYPFIEERVTRDRREHNLLEPPPPQQPDPHRHRRSWSRLLRHPVGRGRCRHDGRPVPPLGERPDPPVPGTPDLRPTDRLQHHPPPLPEPAVARCGRRGARHRDRPDPPASQRRVRRRARPGQTSAHVIGGQPRGCDR
jgi:ubiquinol-cytochrome c reductase cytochrome b subunit